MLRHAHLLRAGKRELEAGRLGQLARVLHEERVASWHFAHNDVRGNWHPEATSSPMLLAKACHGGDDALMDDLTARPPRRPSAPRARPRLRRVDPRRPDVAVEPCHDRRGGVPRARRERQRFARL